MQASCTPALLYFLLNAIWNARALVAFPVATLATGLVLLNSGVSELPASSAFGVNTAQNPPT